MNADAQQVVFTNKARCRDCYRCLRFCPVKAIRMQDGQAFVVAERCIACGMCIRQCPQGAKSFRNDLELAARLLASNHPVAASIAPSFVALFQDWQRKRLPSALRKLGFAHVAETAVGAYHVAAQMAELIHSHPQSHHICTACPAVVSYVENYVPQAQSLLTPLVSPMIAHARIIKQALGPDARVIFIGPCVAKKAEAQRPQNAGAVDCVLTFQELMDWFGRQDIRLESLEESDFDDSPAGQARLFPLEGGSVRTACLTADLLSSDIVCVSGFENIKEAIGSLQDQPRPIVIEPLMCPQGCVNGPAIASRGNVYDRRLDVLHYAQANQGAAAPAQPEPPMGAVFAGHPDVEPPVTEEQIRLVLEKTGKARPEEQLNCGACGYLSCRDKAIAVFRGMAEPEMCIPHVKRLAQQRTDRIIETSPNGIVILDQRLQIMHMNGAFRRFFMTTDALLGKPISYLMDPDQFERVAAGEDVIETIVRHEAYNLTCHQIMYSLRDESQYVGIFVNITKSQASERKLDQLREQTIMQARELLQHQLGMAQSIATFLGESSAKGEQLVQNLLRQAAEDTEEPDAGKNRTWHMPTPK
jgi:PAS domain S-box-containing protein